MQQPWWSKTLLTKHFSDISAKITTQLDADIGYYINIHNINNTTHCFWKYHALFSNIACNCCMYNRTETSHCTHTITVNTINVLALYQFCTSHTLLVQNHMGWHCFQNVSCTGDACDPHLRLTAKPHICMICDIFNTKVNTSLHYAPPTFTD